MKYIIELEDTPIRVKDSHTGEAYPLYQAKEFNTLFFTEDELESMEPYKEPEPQDQEIRVGDEVAASVGDSEQFACVLYENPDGTQCMVLKDDGRVSWWSKAAIHKTGRHFDEVEKLLEELRK